MSSTKTVTIFLAEDHLISRMGLKMLLQQTSHFNVIGEAEDGEAAVEEILKLKPEVVMMDIGLPKIDGIEATARIKAALPHTKILIFTTADDDTSIFAALKAGADGYCLKTISGEMLAIAIESVLNGAAWLDPGIAQKVLRAKQDAAPGKATAASELDLSQSKMELLKLVEQGKSMEDIAQELKINDSLARGLLNELLNQLKGKKQAAKEQQSTQKISTANRSVTVNKGDLVGQHYKIEELIGEGGMGAVYRAKHTMIDRTVAIKTLHEHLASEENTLARFKVEAQSNAAAVHPNLVASFDFGLIEGKIPYIVMEYIEGQSFQDLLDQERKVSETLGKKIFVQICDALEAVHTKGIVHRDLKPANVMLLHQGDEKHFVKVVDFGIAKLVDGSKLNLTRTGECLGSPLYMSPEQCWGGKAIVDHRCDLYALGCMMYESLCGDPIFEGDSIIEVLMKHINREPNLDALEKEKISTETIELVRSLLRKDPNERPASAKVVREHLLKS